MELHHIKQKAAGGSETFDNAIPLCFDCHAEAGHYNIDHPKGLKFSSAELQGHRDRWYRKMTTNDQPSAPPAYIDVDRNTFTRFKDLLPLYCITFLRGHNFAFSFDASYIDAISSLVEASSDPSFEFLDPILEALRIDVVNQTSKFVSTSSTNCFITSGRFYSVPEQWEEANPERFERAVTDLNNYATSLCAAYDEFIRNARRRLAAD